MVEATVRYIKHNALQGRAEELNSWDDDARLAVTWRDEVANVRLHQTARERPADRFEQERARLRPLPALAFDTDEVAPAIVSSHARVRFDGNRYSVPPDLCDPTVLIRADAREVRIVAEGVVVARHARCYDRRELLVSPDLRLEALKTRQRGRVREVADADRGDLRRGSG